MNDNKSSNEFHKVLMIAGFFPPAGGVGTFRITKFVKYLRDYGWEPIVITMREENYHPLVMLDHSLMNDIPYGIKVVRTKVCKSHNINDIGLRWIPFLFFELRRIIIKEHPTVAYFTAGPFFPLIIAPIVKTFFKLDYVVDLRDPWTLSYKDEPVNLRRGKKELIGRYFSYKIEKSVIKKAKKIICVSDEMCEEYRKAYKNSPTGNFTVITNGYDEDDYQSAPSSKFHKYTVVYTGRFMVGRTFRDPSIFFQSMKILRDRGIDIKFIHVGKAEKIVFEKATIAGIQDSVECVGEMTYKESIAFAQRADLLLLIGCGQKSEQTAKIFDYFGCKRPILALARLDGGIEKIVKHIPYARIIENSNPMFVASTIMEFYDNRFEILPNNIDFSMFSRKYLTRCLGDVLNEIVS